MSPMATYCGTNVSRVIRVAFDQLRTLAVASWKWTWAAATRNASKKRKKKKEKKRKGGERIAPHL